MQRILNSGHLPSALEITDSFTLRAARNYLGDSALPSGCRGYLIVEVDGRRPAVREELDSLCTLLEECGATGILRADTEAEAEAIWQLRREFSYSLKATGMTKLNEDIVIPRSRLVALVEFCEALNRETGLDIACFGHSGDGNIHTNIMVDDYANPEESPGGRLCGQAVPLGAGTRRRHYRGTRHRPGEGQMVPEAVGKAPTTCTNWSNPPWTQKFAESWKNGASVT